jgi:nucleotide-binding universal stress UspA family protein
MQTILVPFRDTEAARAAFEAAVVIAKRFSSYVEGLLSVEGPHLEIAPGVRVPADYLTQVTHEWRQVADAARTTFRRLGQEAGLAAGEVESDMDGPRFGWREVEGREGAVVAEHGRLFDLIVLGRATESGSRWQEVLEAALFETGRPVLLVAPGARSGLARRVLIAWNGSSETARTVTFALPLIAKAEQVTVLSVEHWRPSGGPTGREFAAHLKRHGLALEAKTIATGPRTVGEVILAEAQAMDADLVVKGAYTRSRLRQVIFGGATEHVLQHSPIPVFTAH